MKGIDVSKHNGNVNWSHVKADGVEFAIIRAGYGKEISQKDVQFENNYAGCKSNGVPVGAYWYSYATSEAEARQEAAVCLQVLKGKTFEFPIYYDIEEKKQFALGKAACTAIARAFLEVVEKAGYWVGLYSSTYFLQYFESDLLKRYAVWVAQYGAKCTYSGQYGIWQKSSTGKVYGISGNVDMNDCYVNYADSIRNAGLNGFRKSTPASAPATAKPTQNTWKQGQKVQLYKSKTQLFANDTTTTPAGYLTPGTYYIYDGIACKNGRYRITTTAGNCGKTPAGKYVTGYVSVDNFREM